MINKITKYNYNLKYKRTVKGLLHRMWDSQLHPRTIKLYGEPEYNFSEFVLWVLLTKFDKFGRLYFNWVDNGYKKELRPSIDRINPYKGYNIKNIQIITWQENDDKGKKERGYKRIDKRKVLQLNKNGILIKEWNSVYDASKVLNCDSHGLRLRCKGIGKTYVGYIWRYK